MIIVVAAVSMTMAMTIVIVNGRYSLFFSSEHMTPAPVCHKLNGYTTAARLLPKSLKLKTNYNVL